MDDQRRRALRALAIVGAAALPAGLVGAAEGRPGPRHRPMAPRLAAHVSGVVAAETQVLGRRVRATSARMAGITTARAAARLGLARRLSSNTHPDGQGLTCSDQFGSNVRQNQNCVNVTDPDLLGRGQAQNETAIAADPNAPDRLVGGANDYRRGDGGCGAYFSNRGGRRWGDDLIPISFVRTGITDPNGPVRRYFTSSGDPTVAFDSRGTAYYVCQAFNRTPPTANEENTSGFFLFRSPNGGASWTFPGRPVVYAPPEQTAVDLEDKEYLAADRYPQSPYRDRLYVAWVEFRFTDAAHTPALEIAQLRVSYSADHGETWSAPQDISGADATLCPNGIASPNACDVSQFPQPFVGPDGAVYVVFQNFNNNPSHHVGDDEGGGATRRTLGTAANPNANNAQVLLVRSTDGGATWSGPVKVADFYDTPDCVTYTGQDAGRGCFPTWGSNGQPGSSPSFFRAENYPVGVVDPRDPSRVLVTFGSYVSRRSREPACVPAGFNPDTAVPLYRGVGVPGGCNNDIVLSVSTNGGATFTGATRDVRDLPVVNADRNRSDQFWQWADITRSGRLVVSYYDRGYGDDQRTGFMEVSLSAARSSAAERFATRRVTTHSMPPPTQFAGLFMGDYSGLALTGNVAHPSWTDTRNPAYTSCTTGDVRDACLAGNDQDVFTARVPLP